MNRLTKQFYSIFRSHENTSGKKFFPRFPDSTLEKYADFMESIKQYRILFDEENNIIAYADYWFFESQYVLRNKSWEKPWPLDISKGKYAYSYFMWVHPLCRDSNIPMDIINNFRNEFKDTYVCYHSMRRSNKFVILPRIGDNHVMEITS